MPIPSTTQEPQPPSYYLEQILLFLNIVILPALPRDQSMDNEVNRESYLLRELALYMTGGGGGGGGFGFPDPPDYSIQLCGTDGNFYGDERFFIDYDLGIFGIDFSAQDTSLLVDSVTEQIVATAGTASMGLGNNFATLTSGVSDEEFHIEDGFNFGDSIAAPYWFTVVDKNNNDYAFIIDLPGVGDAAQFGFNVTVPAMVFEVSDRLDSFLQIDSANDFYAFGDITGKLNETQFNILDDVYTAQITDGTDVYFQVVLDPLFHFISVGRTGSGVYISTDEEGLYNQMVASGTSIATDGNSGSIIVTASPTEMFSFTNNLTDYAALQTATLTNSPIAGNPSKWVAIIDDSTGTPTTRYIPTWS